MPSSKFSSPKRYYKRPAICKKSPPPPPALLDQFLPMQLTAEIQIADWNPPFPAYDKSFIVTLDKRPNPTFYSGSSPEDPFRVSLTINRLDPIGLWYHQMTILTPYGNMVWKGQFWVEPARNAFDSKLIKEVNVPHQDFRHLKIIG